MWKTENLGTIQQAGLLYAIDMSILASLESFTARDGTTRFTPGTITLLSRMLRPRSSPRLAIRW